MDTGSESTIVLPSLVKNNSLPGDEVEIVGVTGNGLKGKRVHCTFLIYDKELCGSCVIIPSVCCVFGMDWIPRIFPEWLPIKRLKFQCCLSNVKIDPVKLPYTPPSFTPQYPIKGGLEDIDKKLNELLKEGIVERTVSHQYNSPVWPVKKPNGSYRFTVDYRNINKATLAMPGQLPDIEGIFQEIQDANPSVFMVIDLSDMFFAIPLHEESRELTTFTWKAKQYQFTRVPQGYKNSPIIAHNAIQKTLPFELIPNGVHVWTYVDDIMVAGNNEQQVKSFGNLLVEKLQNAGWTINPDEIQGPSTNVKFLGIEWSATGPKIPQTIINKIQALEAPKNKKEAQHVIGMFGYWRHHVPYLQIILKPIYQLTRKTADFEWGEQQQMALDTAKQYLSAYAQLYIPGALDTLVLDVLFLNEYANWGIYTRSEGRLKPISFYCTRFPFSENKYSLFEKTTWTLLEGLKTLTSLWKDQCLIIRTAIPMMDWLKMSPEELKTVPMEQKVLLWKWHIQELLRGKQVRTSNSVGKLPEEVANSPVAPVPEAYQDEVLSTPIGKWNANHKH